MNQPTSVQMLDAAIWQGAWWRESQRCRGDLPYAPARSLSRLLLARSEYPEMEAIKLFAKVQAYVAQPERFL
jgi:hypothetical protein